MFTSMVDGAAVGALGLTPLTAGSVWQYPFSSFPNVVTHQSGSPTRNPHMVYFLQPPCTFSEGGWRKEYITPWICNVHTWDSTCGTPWFACQRWRGYLHVCCCTIVCSMLPLRLHWWTSSYNTHSLHMQGMVPRQPLFICTYGILLARDITMLHQAFKWVWEAP